MVGILLALGSALFGGLASVYMGALSKDKKFDNFEDLVLQYKSEILVVLLVMIGAFLFFDIPIFPETISLKTIGLLAVIGIIGYFGIVFLYKGFSKLNPAIVLIIAQLNIFMMYFLNVNFFDSNEKLSALKIIFAILFFLTTTQFILPGKKLDKKEKKMNFCIKSILPDFENLKINKFALYPILTAICRTAFTFVFIYLNKSGTLNPMQSTFFTELSVGIFAVIALFFTKGKFKSFVQKLGKSNFKTLKLYLILGVVQIVNIVLMGYAYTKAPANIVNVIKLFAIIITAVFARIIFKEKMSKRNIILMIIAFVFLVIFVLV